MPRFLDLQTSMNSSLFGAPNTPMSTDETNPDLFGGIGLETQNVPNPVVDLSGTIGVSGAAGTTFTIRIVRNSPTIAGTIIYTAVHSTTGNPVDLVSFCSQDLGAPAGLLTTYAAFVNTVTGSDITRVGPEVFYGIAAED